MSEEDKKDVTPEDPSASNPKEDGEVVTPESDKDKNFANLRQAKEKLEQENEELRKQVEAKNDRSLEVEPEDPEPSKKKEETPEVLKTIFQRDMKEATKRWNKDNQVTAEEWSQIKSKVSLKGDETQSEIVDKIDEAYNSLPTTRQKREKELIEQGRKQAMQQFNDDELDVGVGGDVDLGGGGTPQASRKAQSFAKKVGGMSDDEIKQADSEDASEWKVGKQPTRKFFQG